MSIQFFSVSVIVYLYQNHNEILTASCCVNKNTDPTCQAKCVLERTENDQKESGEILKKEISALYYQEVNETNIIDFDFLKKSVKTSFYENQYSFSFQEITLKPPQYSIS